MDALELLLTRRSCVVRDMIEPGPSPDELTSIVAAGIRVPDHGKLFPWRIQTLDKSAQAELGQVFATRYRAAFPEASPDEIETEQHRPARAPALIVVSNRLVHNHPKIPVIEQLLSGGAVCQNLLMAAHALGYVAQWVTEWPAYDGGVKRALGHKPTDDIVGFIYVGTAGKPPNERHRADLDEVASTWRGPGIEGKFPGDNSSQP